MYQEIAANKRKSVLLIALFFAVIGLIAYALGQYLGDSYGILMLAALLATIMALVGYYGGDKIALSLAGAYPVSREQNPYIWNLVENLCISVGLPMPKVYLMPEQAMNAFACGRDPAHASVALTEGLVAKLENEELEGVIAHELSHVKNFDIRLATLVAVLVGMTAIMSNIFMRSGRFLGGRRSREGGTGAIVLIGLVLAILAPLIAQLIKLAISRKRELLADAQSALMTRYPEGLARALEKIEAEGLPLQRVSEATAHLYLASPFGREPGFLGRLFLTHPPITERVKALRQMA